MQLLPNSHLGPTAPGATTPEVVDGLPYGLTYTYKRSTNTWVVVNKHMAQQEHLENPILEVDVDSQVEDPKVLRRSVAILTKARLFLKGQQIE